LEKVVPKSPSFVLGLPVYAPKNQEKLDAGKKLSAFQYVGRVTQVSEAPRRQANTGTMEMGVFITIEDDKGLAQTFEYGRLEWRAGSVKSSPQVGVLLTSASP
jgi:hypothetical protein